jgi:hypothetical protein
VLDLYCSGMGSVGPTEIFLFFAIFAVSCGWSAYRRGRSVIGWAVVGLFLGPLALALVLLLPRASVRRLVAPGQAPASESS